MKVVIDHLRTAATPEEQLNDLAKAGELIRKNAHDKFVEQHKNETAFRQNAAALEAAANRDAADKEVRWFNDMKVRADLMERIKGQLKTQTEEQKKATEEQLARLPK